MHVDHKLVLASADKMREAFKQRNLFAAACHLNEEIVHSLRLLVVQNQEFILISEK